jgi:hypothetical protein
MDEKDSGSNRTLPYDESSIVAPYSRAHSEQGEMGADVLVT